MTTITNKECKARESGVLQTFVSSGTLCAFTSNGTGTCFGDSGSPLATNGQLIGVVSWADSCGHGVPDGFSRISSYLKWIQKVSGVVAV